MSDEFPDRPQHPDFERMSAVVIKLDLDAEAGIALTNLVGADLESVVYMADQRALRSFGPKRWALASPTLRQGILALYLDAFALGAGFNNLGGHRPN